MFCQLVDKIFLAYLPLTDEPSIDALIELGRETKKTIAVPVFSATSMYFVHFTSSFDDLPVDKYG